MRRKGPILALLALVVVLAVGYVGYSMLGSTRAGAPADGQAAPAAEPAAESDDAPEADRGPMLADFDPTVYTADGTAVTFTELADGKPLVVNFWATWCPYCIEELPDFQQIVDEYDGRVSFAFVDAADGQRETVDIARTWIAENGFDDLPVYYDTSYDAIYMFGVRAYPTTMLVSADGRILGIQSGMIDPDLMRGALDTLV